MTSSLPLPTAYFALRIDGDFPAVCAWADRLGFGGFGVRELGSAAGGEHWHFLLCAPKKISAVRTSFNRELPGLKGNGKYSLTAVVDLAKYERYLAKGESEGQSPEVAWRSGLYYTEEKLEELHVAYWVENRKMKRKMNLNEKVMEAVLDKKLKWDDRLAISKLYIKELVAANRPVNLFSVRSNVQLIQLKICPNEDALDNLCATIGI